MFAWENAQAVKRREDKHRQIKHRQDQLKKAKQANVKGTAAATTDKPEGKKSKSNRKAESTDETPSAKKSKVKKSKPDSAEGTSKPKTMPAKAAAEDCVSGADKTAAAAPESDAHVRSKRKERKYKKAQARAAVEREGGAAAVTEGAPPAKRVRSGSDSAAAAATAPTVSQTSKAVEKRSAAKPDGKREHKTAKRPATADTAATATAATTTTGVTAAARPSSAAVSKSKRGAGAEKRTGPTATRPASAPAHANGTAKRTGPAGRSVAHTSDKRQGRSSASSAAPNGTATARHEAHALTALGDTGSSEKRAPRRVRQAKVRVGTMLRLAFWLKGNSKWQWREFLTVVSRLPPTHCAHIASLLISLSLLFLSLPRRSSPPLPFSVRFFNRRPPRNSRLTTWCQSTAASWRAVRRRIRRGAGLTSNKLHCFSFHLWVYCLQTCSARESHAAHSMPLV